VRQRILIVEDDAAQRASLCAWLAQQDYYVEAAVNGLDGIQRARLGWFDVVLIHAELPEVDGLAAARLIIDLTRDHGSPKIIALATNTASLLERSPAAGALFFAIVARPCEPVSLLATIRQAHADGHGTMAWDAPPEHGDGAPACASWPKAADAFWRMGARPGGKLRVLIADDDDLPRVVLAALLNEEGYEVEPAEDGLEAMLMMGSNAYDAAILDYDLPKMNGAAAARLAHDLLAREDRPLLIALTAHPALVQDRERGASKVFDDIIPKSAGFGPVIGAVERCLGARRRLAS
jgi:CheY-like chemotaxis protein